MKLNKKALLSVILATAMSISAFAVFEKKNTYTDGQFNDVASDAWYAKEVKSTYELGLMNGKGDGLFVPEGDVTVAEAVTMAARAAAVYAGEEIPSAEGAWYQMYINYAKSKGFLADGQFDNFDRPAKRYEVAKLFENAMPDSYFTAKNNVENIPDIPDSRIYKSDVLTLYKAGVVMGSDSFGNFNPEYNITRAEAAAIINRVALPESRLVKALDKISEDDAYTFIKTPTFTSNSGLFSGWLFDNRGGLPRNSATAPFGSLIDVREDAGTALIREFNKTSTGKIDLYAKLTASGDGAFLEFRNDADESVYKAELTGSKWILYVPGGTVTLTEIAEGEDGFLFNIVLDLDNSKATTYINGKLCATEKLLTQGEKTNVLNFRIATTEKSKAVVSVATVNATTNYALFEDFAQTDDGAVPKYWNFGNGAVVSGTTLNLTSGGASAAFDAVSGKIIAEFDMLLPAKETVCYTLMSGVKNVLSFTTDASNMYVNGTKVYDNYYANLWYRMRFELDTDKQVILVKLNGRKIADVAFAEAATSVNSLSVINYAATKVLFDDFKVFKYVEHDDYVPVPVIPEGADDYNIGINVCSLWKNGATFNSQWSNISPYSDREPVLGYYDEGLAETADWEIKYLLEHGVDFQAFCVFLPSLYSPIRLEDNDLAAQLFDGFMNAKYSDMAKYCMLWEATGVGVPVNVQQMDDYVVPFIVENFFKDPRYMVIDNQPVICIFNVGNLKTSMGSEEKAKEALDRIEAAAIELGYDGVLFLATNPSSKSLKDMGIDGSYAYHWVQKGTTAHGNIESITASANEGSIYTVPTVSVGFNSMAWHGTRYSLISMSDYDKAHKWVRDEYLPEKAKEDWQKNLVMISTWNEYGEGTYIMPTTDERGFGYLDIIRDTYTKAGKGDASVNLIPTESQRYRINHLYPQYRKILRHEGYPIATVETTIDDLTPVYTIDYTQVKVSDSTVWDADGKKNTENGIAGTTKNDTVVMIQDLAKMFEGVETPSLDTVSKIRVTAKLATGAKMEVFYITEEDKSWSQSKSKSFSKAVSDEITEYVIDIKWTGKLKGFRLDPAAGSGYDFEIMSVEFLVDDKNASRYMTIDGEKFEQTFTPARNSAGAMLVAFDPKIALDYRLNCFHQWYKDTGVLKLDFIGHSLEFKVGESKYKLDGEEKDLGYKIETVDSLPLVPIELICEAAGYDYILNAAREIEISTNGIAVNGEIDDKKEASWEFNTVGNTEKWSSGFMSLLTYNGAMSCESMSDSTDPTINLGEKINFPAAKYSKLEIKVRYKYAATKEHNMQMFFSTDKSTGMSEAKSIKIKLNSKDSGKDFEVYTYDLTKLESWKDNIISLRFDPFNAKGKIEIDYIRFIENPDYDPEAIAAEEARKKAEELANAKEYPAPEFGLEHEKYGTLIWYSNFDDNPVNDAAYAVKGQKFTCGAVMGSIEIVDNPAGSGKSLKVTPNQAHGGFQVDFSKMVLTDKGTYTFVADYYIPEGSKTNAWLRWETTKNGKASDPSSWKSEAFIKEIDAWNTYVDSIAIDDETTAIKDFSARKESTEVYYLDNIKIYFKAN